MRHFTSHGEGHRFAAIRLASLFAALDLLAPTDPYKAARYLVRHFGLSWVKAQEVFHVWGDTRGIGSMDERAAFAILILCSDEKPNDMSRFQCPQAEEGIEKEANEDVHNEEEARSEGID